MSKGKLTITEVIEKADNIGKITTRLRQTVRTAKAARRPNSEKGEEVSANEWKAIKDGAQLIVDEAQALVDELVMDILD